MMILDMLKNRDNFVAEALDLVTATINLLLLCKVTDLDFNKHIEKLNAYRNGKYKKWRGGIGEKEEIYKIIDERVETKIKDLKNINNLKSPYRKVEVILKLIKLQKW